MMTMEQDGRSDTRIVTVDIERDMKLGKLVWMKGWENKYGMECRRYLGVIPGYYYGTIAYQEGSIYVFKHHR